MAATAWPRVFEDDGWRFEIKWDGVRVLLFYDDGVVKLKSRSGLDATIRYPELTTFRADRATVLDGEIVALDETGRPSFERLQGRMNLSSPALVRSATEQVPITYVVFDVLYDGSTVTSESWAERRQRLERVELSGPIVPSDAVSEARSLWDFVVERDLEGIVAKRADSPYRPGKRSPDWRKIASFRTVRAVVGGFTPGEGGRGGAFGALLLGLWEGGRLRWIGSVGSGFSDESLVAIRGALDEMRSEVSLFVEEEAMPRRAMWVAPQLVAMVQYRQWTSAGRLRAPSFKGFTDDPVEAVTWAAEGPEAPPQPVSPPPSPW